MKNNKIILMIVTTVCIVASAFGLAACDGATTPNKPSNVHNHEWATTWSANETSHWHACTVTGCTEKNDVAAHSYTAGDCVCGKLHTHIPMQTWTANDTQHWKNCTVTNCTEKLEVANHDYTNGDCLCGTKKATEGLAFTLNSSGDGYSVSKGTATDTEIVIPSTYNGKPVTSIGSGAFYNCSSLTNITIPSSVTSIGGSAFSGCSSLTSITIPNSVTSIGYSAFGYCSSLTSITIPNSVTSIGVEAFRNCSSLTSITIGNSVTSIGVEAFRNCSSLTSITIPNSVKSIGSGAFYNCDKLIQTENGVQCVDKWIVDCDESVTSVSLRTNTVGIAENAFFYCRSLTSITIPNSVTSIGSEAFRGCSSLTSITFQGTKVQWYAIAKGSYWNFETGKYTVRCNDGNI